MNYLDFITNDAVFCPILAKMHYRNIIPFLDRNWNDFEDILQRSFDKNGNFYEIRFDPFMSSFKKIRRSEFDIKYIDKNKFENVIFMSKYSMVFANYETDLSFLFSNKDIPDNVISKVISIFLEDAAFMDSRAGVIRKYYTEMYNLYL